MKFDLLKKLCFSFGVSGNEEETKSSIKEFMNSLCDCITTDEIGNLICVKYGKNRDKNIVLDAHIDSVGFIVKKIYENGFVSFECIGGIDERILPSQEVIIMGREKICGIITSKPPHLKMKDDNEASSDLLFIDTGLNNGEINNYVSVGDLISYKPCFEILNNKYISATYLDNRVCVASIIEIFEKLKETTLEYNLTAVFSVGEEIGLRGSYFSKEKCNLCIVTDVTFGKTTDCKEDCAFDCGKGVAFGEGPNVSYYYLELLKEFALKNNLKYQTEILEGSSGTNAWGYQIGNNGINCEIVSIPLKYMHTPVETISIFDYDNLIEHIFYFLKNISAENLKLTDIYDLEEKFD